MSRDYGHPIDRLRRREERRKALDSCYMDPDKIPICLEDGLITEEDAKEVRRHHLFDDTFRGNYPLELDSALRRGDITYEEYCARSKEYYVKRDQVGGDREGVIEDWWDFAPENWDAICETQEDYEDWMFWDDGRWKIRKEREREFEIVDYRGPHGLSEMHDGEIEAAARIFYLVEKKHSEPQGITQPLEFLAELMLHGFKLPKYFNRVLKEQSEYDEGGRFFEMSKLKYTRFRNRVRRYASTFWFNLCFNCPEIYEEFWENREKTASLIVK